jgi:hypothetical protein
MDKLSSPTGDFGPYVATPIPQMKLDFHLVTADRWPDFEQLFVCKGGPRNCWCLVWRTNENKKTNPAKSGKKASMKNRLDHGTPIGLLAYSDNEPIAWCSIAPRGTYKSLGGDETKGLRLSVCICAFVHLNCVPVFGWPKKWFRWTDTNQRARFLVRARF